MVLYSVSIPKYCASERTARTKNAYNQMRESRDQGNEKKLLICTAAHKKEVSKAHDKPQLGPAFVNMFANRGNEIARVNSICITKSTN